MRNPKTGQRLKADLDSLILTIAFPLIPYLFIFSTGTTRLFIQRLDRV